MTTEHSKAVGPPSPTSSNDDNVDNERKPLEMMGFNLPIYDRMAQLLFLSAGLMASFMLQNFLQEYIFRIPGFRFGAFTALFEYVMCTVGAAGCAVPLMLHDSHACTVMPGERLNAGERLLDHRRPLHDYIVLTVVSAGSSVCGTSALAYVNMPVKVVFKSSKLIPTMFSGTLLNNQTYSAYDWATSLLLCLMVAAFTLADSQVSLHFSSFGLLLLAAAVVFDSMVPQSQQRLMSTEPAASKAEVIFFSNALGTVLICVTLVLTGEGVSAVSFCAEQPAILLLLLVFGSVTYLGAVTDSNQLRAAFIKVVGAGVFFYISLVKNFGAVTTVLVTTLRKVFTLIVSFIVFGHQCTIAHFVSGGLVMVLSGMKVKGSDKN